MIWTLLLYVLPFLIGCLLLYYFAKKDKETIGEYLKGVSICLIPLLNIIVIIAMIIKTIEEDESVQNFLNRKL